MRNLRRWLLVLFALLSLCASLSLRAAPQVSWSDQVRSASQQEQPSPVALDVLQIWEATRVGQVTLRNDEYFDPDQIWNWPSKRFDLPRTREAYFLYSGERYVARLTLFSEVVGTDLNLSAVLPRLDAMHVSYRYDNGAWKTLSAGDTLPIARWQVPDRHPSFDIPQISGQLDLVVQVAHRGNAFAPVLLQNDRSHVAAMTYSAWSVGMMTGIHLVMALLCALLALSFQRTGFLSVAVMSLLMATVVFFGSGLGGLYLATASSSFNDQIKFFSTTLWCLALPWIASSVLGLPQRQKGWTMLTSSLVAAGTILTWFWMDYRWRDTTQWAVPLMLVLTLLITTSMVLWSFLRNVTLQPAIVVGLLLYGLALLMPFTAFLSLLTNNAASMAAACLMLLAALFLINGLYVRFRMGRQVMARANLSTMRDVLTGLLSREGMQAHLYNKVRDRVQTEQTSAIFIYINVMNAEQAMHELGEQGFEMGMVQMAASLSTSVSGVDGVARISRHAFAISVLMPPDPALATRLAQKILSRLMVLASHGAPLAGTARMALAWLPLFGFRVDALERRCLRMLDELEPVKRIGWVGGAESHAEAAQMQRDARLAYSTPSGLQPLQEDKGDVQKDGASSNLYERIHRIEREMLHGVDTRFLVAEAERMSRVLNEAHSGQGSTQPPNDSQRTVQQDYAPTELLHHPLHPER